MKKLIILATSGILAASLSFAQSVDDIGVFANPERSGDWLFTEIRELDGTLSGCFMSTAPIDGAFSFENADLNILSLIQGGQKTQKFSLLDVAEPMSSNGPLNPIGWFLKIGKPGESPYFAVLNFKARHPTNRFRFEGEVSDRLLDELAKGQVANTGLDRPTLVYSLKGSSKAIDLWRKCDAKI
jgi:hypothetical protein